MNEGGGEGLSGSSPPRTATPPSAPRPRPLQTLLSEPSASLSFSACCSFRLRSWNMSWCRFRVCMIFCGAGGAAEPEPGGELPCPSLPAGGAQSPSGPAMWGRGRQDPPRSPALRTAISAAVGRRGLCAFASGSLKPPGPQIQASPCLRMGRTREPLAPCLWGLGQALGDTPLTALKLWFSEPRPLAGHRGLRRWGPSMSAQQEEGGQEVGGPEGRDSHRQLWYSTLEWE